MNPGTSFLARHHRIGLDTNILIYLVQDHPRYGAWCASLFGRIERRQSVGITSTLVLLEALVQPYRLQDDRLANKFYALFSTYPSLIWTPLTLELADSAAELCARYGLSTPDAIHIATAIGGGATGYIGNDRGLKRVQELACLTLDEVV